MLGIGAYDVITLCGIRGYIDVDVDSIAWWEIGTLNLDSAMLPIDIVSRGQMKRGTSLRS